MFQKGRTSITKIGLAPVISAQFFQQRLCLYFAPMKKAAGRPRPWSSSYMSLYQCALRGGRESAGRHGRGSWGRTRPGGRGSVAAGGALDAKYLTQENSGHRGLQGRELGHEL